MELKDEEILETLRSHKENSLIRTQAIVDMANSFKLATNAIVRKWKRHMALIIAKR